MTTPALTTKWVPMGVKPKVVDYAAVDGKWAHAVGGAMVWDDIPGLITPDADWKYIGVDVAWENGWGPWSDANYNPPRFRKLNDGLVIFSGLLTSGPGSYPAFTMPPGYRLADNPGSTRISHFVTAVSYTPSVWGMFWIYGDGRVQPEANGPGVWVSIDNLRYFSDH